MIVAREHTPLPLAQLLPELHAAGHEALAFCPGVDRTCVAWAQLLEEHRADPPQVGHERMIHGIYGWNFGNRDASAEERADPAVALFETVPEREVASTGQEYHASHVRRAYPDAHAGLVAWWQAMITRWESAWDDMADPEAFAAALKRAGYYTGSEQDYARNLRYLAAEARAAWDGCC